VDLPQVKTGQPVSLCDLFGHILGDMVLQNRKDATLSSQRRAVHQGKAPLPFYSCLNVKNNVPANVFQVNKNMVNYPSNY
jgi:Lysophospholipase catalytic domain